MAISEGLFTSSTEIFRCSVTFINMDLNGTFLLIFLVATFLPKIVQQTTSKNCEKTALSVAVLSSTFCTLHVIIITKLVEMNRTVYNEIH